MSDRKPLNQHKTKVRAKKAQTERKRAIIEAEKKAAVSNITMAQQILEKESQMEMSFIEDQIKFDRSKAFADSEFCEFF